MENDKASLVLPSPPSSSASTPPRKFPQWFYILVALIALLLFHALGKKIFAAWEARKIAQQNAIPLVRTIHPSPTKTEKTIILPGDVQALSDTPIFARTDGYLKTWMVDIGAHVHSGQLLAEIESPEVDQQLNQAVGNVQQAEANAKLAQITTQRWKQMLAQNTVSHQEADEKEGSFESQKAHLIAAQANVQRLLQIQKFEKVFAPFDGTITARNIDVGDLITANNTTQKEMFHIVDDSELRIYINVPEHDAHYIKIGQLAAIKIASLPNVVARGHVAHIARAIDPQSRTMLVEVRVDNRQHNYLSGGYATVEFRIPLGKPPLTLPINTLLFRPEGPLVGVVGPGGRVRLQKVKIGRDFGNYVEIEQGLNPRDQVIVNPSDSLCNKDVVQLDLKRGTNSEAL